MNIYLIKRTDEASYDEYDSAVVVAPSEDIAVRMHPSDGSVLNSPTNAETSWSSNWNGWHQRIHPQSKSFAETWDYPMNDWVLPDKVVCVRVGVASADHTEPTVLCASFNAG